MALFVPGDSGGSPLTKFALYINDGEETNEATNIVTSYNINALEHTLTAADGIQKGKIYKLRFRATNAIDTSAYSDTVRIAFVDPPAAPLAPSAMVA